MPNRKKSKPVKDEVITPKGDESRAVEKLPPLETRENLMAFTISLNSFPTPRKKNGITPRQLDEFLNRKIPRRK